MSSPTRPGPDDPWWPVGTDEIALRLGVTRATVSAWRHRSRSWKRVPRFPEPEGQISGRDWWFWGVVVDWAEHAGRWPPPEPPGDVYRPRGRP